MKLKVTLHGQIIHELSLDEQREYIVGRGNNCDIVLSGERGISKKHIKFYFNGQNWEAVLLSKYGALLCKGESHTQLDLVEDIHFSTPPFEFNFTIEARLSLSDDSSGVQENNEAHSAQIEDDLRLVDEDDPANLEPSSSPEHQAHDTDSSSQSETPGNLEPTQVISPILDAILQIKYPDGVNESVRLTGNAWTAGRSPGCEIYINNDNVSRDHFEIEKRNDGFYITDLKSSNGTKVNGDKLTPHVYVKLESGSSINIKKIILIFTLKNNEFSKSLDLISDEAPASGSPHYLVPAADPQPSITPLYMTPINSGPAVVRVPPEKFNLSEFRTYNSKHKIRAIALLLLPLFAWVLLSDSPEKKNQSSTKPSAPYDKLTETQKESLSHSLEMAQVHYNGKKFALCLSEMSKIHIVLPSGHGNSKQLEVFCKSAKQQSNHIKMLSEQRAEAQKNQEIAERVVSECRDQVSTFNTLPEVDSCLSEASELVGHEHESILEVRQKVIDKIKKIEAERANRQSYVRRLATGKAMFNRAIKLYRGNKYRKSISQLKKFIASSYPDPNNNKNTARKALKEARSKLSVMVNKSLRECKSLLGQNKFRDAMKMCKKAESQDPRNPKISALKSEVRKKLSIRMKEFYQNASIEENFGNIEAAKDLWSKIATEDFPSGSQYYRKARGKLKLYGL